MTPQVSRRTVSLRIVSLEPRLAGAVFGVLVGLCGPQTALAFSGSTDFDRAPVVPGDGRSGGGGGRHFTGAPGDGYPCAVCHLGSNRISWNLNGLPEQYTPGETYEVELTWMSSASDAQIGIQLEIADDVGTGAGELALMEAMDDEICENTRRAASIVPLEDRQIVAVDACSGPRAVRISWTAPATERATLYFGMVSRGEPFGDPSGDLTTNQRLPMVAAGAPPTSIDASVDCHAGGAPAAWPFLLILLGRRR